MAFDRTEALTKPRFLDYAAALIFLRKVGGGYIFVHRLVMEHFAGLSDADIQRIAGAIPGQPRPKRGERR